MQGTIPDHTADQDDLPYLVCSEFNVIKLNSVFKMKTKTEIWKLKHLFQEKREAASSAGCSALRAKLCAKGPSPPLWQNWRLFFLPVFTSLTYSTKRRQPARLNSSRGKILSVNTCICSGLAVAQAWFQQVWWWDLAINFALESLSATYNIHRGKKIVHVEYSSCTSSCICWLCCAVSLCELLDFQLVYNFFRCFVGINPEKKDKGCKEEKNEERSIHTSPSSCVGSWTFSGISFENGELDVYITHMFKQQWFRRLGKFILNSLSKLECWTPLPCSFVILFLFFQLLLLITLSIILCYSVCFVLCSWN